MSFNLECLYMRSQLEERHDTMCRYGTRTGAAVLKTENHPPTLVGIDDCFFNQQDGDVVHHGIHAATDTALQLLAIRVQSQRRLLTHRADHYFEQVLRNHARDSTPTLNWRGCSSTSW